MCTTYRAFRRKFGTLEHADGWSESDESVFVMQDELSSDIRRSGGAPNRLKPNQQKQMKDTQSKKKKGVEALLHDQKRQTKAAQKTNSINKGVTCCAQNEWNAAHSQQMNLFRSLIFYSHSLSLPLCSTGPLSRFSCRTYSLIIYIRAAAPVRIRMPGCHCFLSFHLLLFALRQMQAAHSRRNCARRFVGLICTI